MAALRGTVQGMRGQASRLGSKSMRTEAQSWSGKIVVELSIEDGEVYYEITERPHYGRGINRNIAKGIVGRPKSEGHASPPRVHAALPTEQ